MLSSWINSSFDLTVVSGLVMPGRFLSIGALGLVERTPFLAWVMWPWSDSTETGKYFEALS